MLMVCGNSENLASCLFWIICLSFDFSVATILWMMGVFNTNTVPFFFSFLFYFSGLLKRKEFFVKYKGLAHIHNQWVPESKVLLEAPTLVGKFNRNNQVIFSLILFWYTCSISFVISINGKCETPRKRESDIL